MSFALSPKRGSAREDFGLHVAVLVLLLIGSPVLAQPPHANVPLADRIFTIDAQSPTGLANPSLSPSAILQKPGPQVYAAGLGLTIVDELNAFSLNRSADVSQDSQFFVLFGVDRDTIGVAEPDPMFVAANRPFNVKDQAERRQAAGDIFMGLDVYCRAGLVEGVRSSSSNSTLAKNQGDTGGVDQDLSPDKSATKRVPPDESIDEKDGMSSSGFTGSTPPRTKGSRGSDLAPMFFSISAKSEAPMSTGGGPGRGADIFLDYDPQEPGMEEVFLRADQMDLVPGINGDDIDGLVVFDAGNDGLFDQPGDQILFSLAPGSPTLNSGPYSPADILMMRGNAPGFIALWAPASDFGLGDGDNIDALDLAPTQDGTENVMDYAIQLVVPGDFEPADGMLDDYDCGSFELCYSGPDMLYDSFFDVFVIEVGPGSVFTPIPPAGNPLFIETGDTVEWLWLDGPHSVVSGMGGFDGAFSSPGVLMGGAAWSHVFDAGFVELFPRPGGVYHYFSDVTVDMDAGMSGEIVVRAHSCSTYDFDYDGDVDCDDWREFKETYAYPDPWADGGVCIPLTVPEFVAVLLETSTIDVHYCMADVNDDHQLNGLDVQAYVDAKLSP